MVAHRVLDRIEQALASIADRPGIGHVREDITSDPTIRFWSVGPTLVAYRTDRRPLQVLFIERGERDWASGLGTRDEAK